MLQPNRVQISWPREKAMTGMRTEMEMTHENVSSVRLCIFVTSNMEQGTALQ